MRTIPIVLALSLVVSACSSGPPTRPVARPGAAPAPPPVVDRRDVPPASDRLPTELTLALGETVTVDRGALNVRFANLVSDSRCPAAAHCVRAGEAEVDIELRAMGETATLRLGTPSPTTRVADGALGYAVELLAVEPAPVSTQPLDQAAYRVRLHVDRLAP